MRKTHDLSFYGGSYVDQHGETKHRRTRVGAVLQDGERTKVLIESIPVGVATEKGGIWLDAYPVDNDRREQGQRRRPAPESASQRDDFDDEIPF